MIETAELRMHFCAHAPTRLLVIVLTSTAPLQPDTGAHLTAQLCEQ